MYNNLSTLKYMGYVLYLKKEQKTVLILPRGESGNLKIYSAQLTVLLSKWNGREKKKKTKKPY